MSKVILGKKIGMTQIFDEKGKVIPVTVIDANSCIVTGLKSIDTDGYTAVQLGIGEVKEKKIIKPMKGFFAKGNVTPKKHLKEFRIETENYKIGDEVKPETFAQGEFVDIQAKTKGKGFQGVIKRHGQHRGPMGHGSMYHRRPGSMGSTSTPGRVFKGKKLPGRTGGTIVTIQKLEIVKIDTDKKSILVKGSVPGSKGTILKIRTSVKSK